MQNTKMKEIKDPCATLRQEVRYMKKAIAIAFLVVSSGIANAQDYTIYDNYDGSGRSTFHYNPPAYRRPVMQWLSSPYLHTMPRTYGSW
jgi:hypothetical protein